ncbi:MAG: acyltransferase family protein [Sideroxydans sp.]|nr:acyltransferase family protein [Sideroxydans sp.]
MPTLDKKFYPEIQGLRAVAIIAVILFHFGWKTLAGGYLGVDIFFVISGFLIAQMISIELARGTFNIRRFYKNRVMRLLPNLFLMIIVSVVISYFVLKPYDFFQYAKSLQFSAVYLTNMVFARQQGYFDMSREAKPLLHTWSLSIEEQFYLVFPLMLILLFKFKQHRVLVLSVIALASFWVRYNYQQNHLPTEGFFSFAGRVWEFVIGALIVFLPAHIKARLANQSGIALGSFALIIASLIFLDEAVPYASSLLIIPCVATALIILSSGTHCTEKLLSTRVLVFIGGLSYSLYLWHWPLLVWLHNGDFAGSHALQISVLFALTLAISYLAWRYVEEPFRKNRERFSGRQVGLMTLTFGIFCVSIGGYIYAQSGMENRFPNWVKVKNNLDTFDFKTATGTTLQYPANCAIGDDPQAILQHCAFGDLQAAQRFLVVGDSHVAAWYPAFQAAAEARHTQGVFATQPGCPPLFDISSLDGAKNICAEKFDTRIKALIATRAFNKVYLLASWSMYSEGDPNNQPNHFISDAHTAANDRASSQQVMSAHLQSTIQYLQSFGIEVVLVHSVAMLPKVVQALPENYSVPLAQLQQQNFFMTEFVRDHAAELHLTVLDPSPTLCSTGACLTRANGNVLYTDNNHISPAGAALLTPLVASSM